MIDQYISQIIEKHPSIGEDECRQVLLKYFHLPICLLHCLHDLYAYATSNWMIVSNNSFEMSPWTTQLRVLRFFVEQKADRIYCNHDSCIYRFDTNDVLYNLYFFHPDTLVPQHKEMNLKIIEIRLVHGESLVFKDFNEEQDYLNLTKEERKARKAFFKMEIRSLQDRLQDPIINRHRSLFTKNGKGIFPPPRKIWDWKNLTYQLEFCDVFRYDIKGKRIDSN